MKVIVTGGSGFVGSYIVKELQTAGYAVRNFDSVPPQGNDVETILGDICDLTQLEATFAGCDAICHLAAIPVRKPRTQWHDVMRVNVMGTYNVLEAAARRNVRKVVMASSICAEGWYSTYPITNHPEYLPVDEEHPARPDEPYGMSKYFGDIMGHAFSFHCDISVICLRLANVIPEAPVQGAASLACEFRWATVDPRDAAQAFRLGIETPIKFGIYHIGSHHLYHPDGSIWQPAEMLQEIRAWNVNEIRDPANYLAGAPFFTSAKAERELGYSPRF
jgi:nucleoside-diphosphate-sugar epimerase